MCYLPSRKGKIHVSPFVVKHVCKLVVGAVSVDIVTGEPVVTVGIVVCDAVVVGTGDGTVVTVVVVNWETVGLPKGQGSSHFPHFVYFPSAFTAVAHHQYRFFHGTHQLASSPES